MYAYMYIMYVMYVCVRMYMCVHVLLRLCVYVRVYVYVYVLRLYWYRYDMGIGADIHNIGINFVLCNLTLL